MSLPPELEAFAAAHSTPAPPHLAALHEATRVELDAPEMLSGTVEGRLLETLVWIARPRLVLEIGTYSGSAAQFMAAALPEGGRVITCELNAGRAAFARGHLQRSPVADRVEIAEGPALDTIAAIDEPLDLVFVDAEKEGYVDYYEAVVPKLSERGLIVADNTWRGGRATDPADAIARFNAHVDADPRTVQVLLTVRDGVTLIRLAP